MPRKRGNNNDSLLRIAAMLASIAIVVAGGAFKLDFQIQAVAMGFLLALASGTDPLKLLDSWRNKNDKK